MSNTSATKHKDSFMIMLPIEDKQILSENLISPIYRVEGLAWYVHVAFFYDGNVDGFNMMSPSLHCDLEASEFWKTEAKIQMTIIHGSFPKSKQIFKEVSHTFASWKQRSNMCKLPLLPFTAEFISITIETESESSACRLTLDVTLIPDVILVMEGQKFPMLSSQSSYFNSIFFSDFKESKQAEIEIKETNPEDFHELLKMLYGVSKEPTTVENATRYLMMAEMFDLLYKNDKDLVRDLKKSPEFADIPLLDKDTSFPTL